MRLDPDPFHLHPTGPWHERSFQDTLSGIQGLLERHAAGQVTRHHLLHGKDNGRRKRDTLSYWLYFQHHPRSERWKILGQRYWSERAYASFRRLYRSLPPERRVNPRDGGPSLAAIPKRSICGDEGLVSEHVVPKAVLKALVMSGAHSVADLLRLNLCAVVTRVEDRRLPRNTHPDPFDPWLRYAGLGVRFIENPVWEPDEREALARHGLLARSAINCTPHAS